MLWRILSGSFARQKRRKAVAFLAVALGTAAASALMNLALGVGDQVNRELRGFGANLVVTAQGSSARVQVSGQDLTTLQQRIYLDEEDILKAKDNFWIHNILALAPVLEVEARTHPDLAPIRLMGTWFRRAVHLEDGTEFRTGIRDVYPYWSVAGRWPQLPGEAVVGRSLARSLDISSGDSLDLAMGDQVQSFEIVGVLEAGGDEDRAILTFLDRAQELAGLEGRIDRILISALTTPEDKATDRLGLEAGDLSAEDFEQWSCTPFVSSIAYQLEQSVPRAMARPIRRVAETEGRILERIGGLLTLIALMAGLASALTVTSALTTGVLERRSEIGLLKSLGATNARVVGLFLAEASLLGIAGGLVGGAGGVWLAQDLSRAVFGTALEISPFAFPLAVLAAVSITLIGCALPVRRIVSFRPFEVLHGL